MRFSIRDLLWLTVAVALVLGWLVHGRTMNNEYRRMALENESLRDELYEERLPKMEAAQVPQLIVPLKDQTLEWIPPTTH